MQLSNIFTCHVQFNVELLEHIGLERVAKCPLGATRYIGVGRTKISNIYKMFCA